MRSVMLLSGLMLCGTSLSVLACESPAPLAISGDELAQEPNRLTMQVDMLQYASEMAGYVNCLQEEYESLRDKEASSPELVGLADLNNEAVAQLETTRDLYVAHIGPIGELTALEPKNCIEINRNARPDVDVVDDRNLLIYAQDGDAYRNVLKQECAALTRNLTRLSFGNTPTGQLGVRARNPSSRSLCNGFGIITSGAAPTTDAGARMMSGCRLGQFFPITRSEADELLEHAQ